MSIRGIKRCYANLSGVKEDLTPKDIFDIAEGTKTGNQMPPENLLSNSRDCRRSHCQYISMIDGLIVIGGGLAAASKPFLPAMLQQLNGTLLMMNGQEITRIPQKKVYNLDDDTSLLYLAKELYVK